MINLKSLTNLALDAKVISLAKKEKELLAEAILHIAEVERRKLYREMGIPSLYGYLTKHAEFSNGSACRLMDAARLQLEVPELAQKIESGKINMTQVRLVQEAARQRKKEQAGRLLADNAPSEFGQQVASLELAEGLNSVESAIQKPKIDKAEILESIQNRTEAESEQLVAESFDLKVKQPMKVTCQKDGSVVVQMSFTAAQWAEIEKVKVATSSSLPAGGYPEVFVHLAQKENQKRQTVAKPRKSTAALTPAKKKSILQRDQCCQFKHPSGEICGTRFNLQVDHIKPRWASGKHEVENLQILCAAHNRMKYEMESGIRRP